jgi:hypothetical protein
MDPAAPLSMLRGDCWNRPPSATTASGSCQCPGLPGAMAEFKHHLGTAAFQIDETVLWSLIGNLKPEHSTPEA